MVKAGNDRKDTSEVNKFRNATVMAKKKNKVVPCPHPSSNRGVYFFRAQKDALRNRSVSGLEQ
ncbi:hypothetical protein Lpp189_10860 [Lacticaseibacillus paracasei subsp. paracasei Lpp189]|nr:hypothetical protein Lpp189_10860 [Lacticaseibacillus paracasei subsp. paracasei Lpp189]